MKRFNPLKSGQCLLIPEEILEKLDRGFNPLKSGQCLLITSSTSWVDDAIGFNPLKSGQCLLIKIRSWVKTKTDD